MWSRACARARSACSKPGRHCAQLQTIAQDCLTTGRLIGYDTVTDPEIVAQHEEWILRGLAAATPYEEYVAADPTRVQPPIRLRTTKSG
jgi:hypothetical protein